MDTLCVTQNQAARWQADTLLLSKNTCATLLGYAIAQPHRPKAGTQTAFQVSVTALDVLRVIANATGAAGPDTDCRAMGLFYPAFRGLGATSGEALALRTALLDARTQLHPALTLSPGCPIH